ncbi:MAG: hypothetical protein RL199_1139 [Pseudomonadota bacterium]
MNPHRPGKEIFTVVVPAHRLDALWASVGEARRRRDLQRLLRRVIAGAAGAAAVVTTLVVAFVARNDSGGPLRYASGRPVVAEGAASLPAAAFPLAFSDGSRIAGLRSPGLAIVENSRTRFLLQLGRGAARFEVTPGGPRRWVVETDLATVEVIGTVFEVDRDDAGLDVRVEHGIVLVRGEQVPERMRRLTQGESLHIDAPQAPDARPAPVSDEPAPGRPTPPSPASRPTPRPTQPTSRTPKPAELALDDLLDELEATRRAGGKEASRKVLGSHLPQARTNGERTTLLMTLAQWTSDDGDDVAAATLLAGITPEGLPRELVRAAWRLEASCWRRAGRPGEAEAVERRILAPSETGAGR